MFSLLLPCSINALSSSGGTARFFASSPLQTHSHFHSHFHPSTEKVLRRHSNHHHHHRLDDDKDNLLIPFNSTTSSSSSSCSSSRKSSSNLLFTITPLAGGLMAAALVVLSPLLCDPPASFAQVHTQRGAFLFSKACIGCHYGGGNIIQPGATLFLKDLQRNNIQTEEDIYKITYYGNGRMPGFGEKCTPRGQCTFGERLKDEDIKLLAQYVKSQAELEWENTEITSNGD